MKTLHLGMIGAILILSIPMLANATMYGGHLGPISSDMLFMKSNSNATIKVEYVINYPHNGTISTEIGIYDARLYNPEPITSNDLTVQADPISINLTRNNTVTYTIAAKNNIKGVYAMSLFSSCGKSPLVVGLNESDVLPSALFTFAIPYHCGVMTDELSKEITGYNGIISKTVSISQNRFSPLEQTQLGSNATDVQCKQGFDLIIKTHDNMSACVKPDTAKILIERGWGSLAPIPISLPYPKQNNGTLSGDVALAGGPGNLVGPKANYEVGVYATDGVTIVAKTLTDTNAHYSIQLPTGNYIIYVPDYPTKQTHLVSVFSGKNTILNIVYGTGYK